MLRPHPPLVPLHELVPGQVADCYALLAARLKGATREGKPYYSCRFQNRRRTVSCMVWSDSPWYEACDQEWREGECYKLRAAYGEHEIYGPQIELHKIRAARDSDHADGLDPADLVQSTRFDVDELFADLTKLVETEIKNDPLRRLVLNVLERFAAPLKTLPATAKQWYPFHGGLLEHTLSVSRTSLWLADHYIAHYADAKPPLDRDLVLAGAVLHDIGRVVELDADSLAPQPTVPGRLLGYLVLGRDLIRDAARELGDVDPDSLQILEHLVLTHPALPEGTVPETCLVPECLILHYADELDTRMEMYGRCLARDRNAGPFTAREPLLGKRLLKQRSS